MTCRLFTGFARPFTVEAARGSRFLSLFFRAASPMTRFLYSAFYYYVAKRYFVANASLPVRICRHFCSSQVRKPYILLLKHPYGTRLSIRVLNFTSLSKRYAGFVKRYFAYGFALCFWLTSLLIIYVQIIDSKTVCVALFFKF